MKEATVAILLLLSGQIWQAIFVIVMLIAVVGNIDAVLRPMLVPREAYLNPALTLLSNGYFVVGWRNQGGLKLQAFDPNGNEIGVEHDQGGMIDADIAGVTDGRLIGVRSSTGADAGGAGAGSGRLRILRN